MNAEELKMIMEAITMLGAQGKDAFIWYLVIKYLVGNVLIFITMMSIVTLIYNVVRQSIEQESGQQQLQQIRTLCAVGTGGYYTNSEHDAVIAAIRELKKS